MKLTNGWSGGVWVVAMAVGSGCGETSHGSDGGSGSSSGGTSGSDGAVSIGTTGTAMDGPGESGAIVTNTIGSTSTTGTTMPAMHCHTAEQVRAAEAMLRAAGAGGEAGAPNEMGCPEYYPHVFGPPCGGELLPGATSSEGECCYTMVICN